TKAVEAVWSHENKQRKYICVTSILINPVQKFILKHNMRILLAANGSLQSKVNTLTIFLRSTVKSLPACHVRVWKMLNWHWMLHIKLKRNGTNHPPRRVRISY